MVWKRGGEGKPTWYLRANHGGGYSYRLCKYTPGVNVTEACFQQTHGAPLPLSLSFYLPTLTTSLPSNQPLTTSLPSNEPLTTSLPSNQTMEGLLLTGRMNSRFCNRSVLYD